MPIIARGGFSNRVRHQDAGGGYDPDRLPHLPFRVPPPPRRHKDKKDECVCWVPFMWSTCGVTFAGIFIFALGCGLVVLGYYTEFLNEQNKNVTVIASTEINSTEVSNPGHLRHQLVIAGPIVMGIGCFMVVVACTVVFEAREKALKQLTQEPKPDRKMTLYDNLVLKFNDDAQKSKDKRRKSKISLRSITSRNSSVFSVEKGMQNISSILVNPWVLGMSADTVTKSALCIQTLAAPRKETRSGSAVFPFQENGQQNGNSLRHFGSRRFAENAKSAKRNMPLPILLPLYPGTVCDAPTSPVSLVPHDTQYEVRIMIHNHGSGPTKNHGSDPIDNHGSDPINNHGSEQNEGSPQERTDVHSIHTLDHSSSEGSSLHTVDRNELHNNSSLPKVVDKKEEVHDRSLKQHVDAPRLNQLSSAGEFTSIEVPVTAEPLYVDNDTALDDDDHYHIVPKAPPGSPALPRRYTMDDDTSSTDAQYAHTYVNPAFSHTNEDMDANNTDAQSPVEEQPVSASVRRTYYDL